MINKDDFISELNDFLTQQEKDMLDIDDTNEHLINDNHQANYFVKLSKEVEEDMNRVKQYIQAERDRILSLLERYEDEELNRLSRQKEYYDKALEDYIHRELDGSNKRSIKLPYGTIAIKRQQPHYTYTDETIIEWAKDSYPDLIKTTIPEPKLSINKTDLKKQGTIIGNILYIDGKEVPGVYIEQREDKFEIK